MRFKTILLLLFSLTAINCAAQDYLAVARSLASEGKFKEAIRVYSEILIKDETHTAARLGRGFTYSWNHDFVNATADFHKILQTEPGNMEAQKGLAYIDLWAGQNKKAISSFNVLIEKEESAREFYIARGQAQLNEGLLKEARRSFEKARELDPSDKEAEKLITAVRTRPTLLDIDIIGGISSTGSETSSGLRLLQISSQVSQRIQLTAKYDNSLSIDNLGLILRNQSVPYYAGSMLYKWNQKTITRIESGFRSFKGSKTNEPTRESQFSLEQVLFLNKNKSIKAGIAFINPDAGESAYLFFTGYRQALGRKVNGGINYFYANRNIKGTTENRFLADADFFLSKGKVLSAGFYYGKSNSNDKILTGTINGGFLRGYFPVSNFLGIHMGIAAENNFLQDLFTINAGIRFRLEK